MSYLNRVWMAASVAVVQGHPADQGSKWKSGLRSLQQHGGGKRRLSSSPGADGADFRPLSGAVGSECGGGVMGGDDVAMQKDESLRRVMYLNCWGQG
ncbi:hypothetical protein Tsubulata_022805 [Turnera subulata]|uniref:Wound-responsive family protein n=1 Tax=Turnera subulata TaxID=218843 RepID=A0A9Q0IZ09_9ROSI|nr:hypothetical protein Tsubulata_022805 [Turnera subulata]